MRILLDECLPKRLGLHLPAYEVRTVPQMGWAGIKNGQLLSVAEKHFEVFVTIDQSLRFQQTLVQFNLAVLVLRAKTNKLADLLPLIPKLRAALPSAAKGKATLISE